MHWEIVQNKPKEWLARCPAHGLTALGDSWEDLQEMVREITRDFLGRDDETTWEKRLDHGIELRAGTK